MNWRITTSILIICLIASSSVSAQRQADMQRLKALFPTEKAEKKTVLKIDFSNEIQLLLTGSFTIYKKYVSPQDALSCSFYPSCSAYALETVQSNGVMGIFDAIDRLTRCNGFSPEKYEVHPITDRFYDPVKKIH